MKKFLKAHWTKGAAFATGVATGIAIASFIAINGVLVAEKVNGLLSGSPEDDGTTTAVP